MPVYRVRGHEHEMRPKPRPEPQSSHLIRDRGASRPGGGARSGGALILAVVAGLAAGDCGAKLDPVQERDAAGLEPTWCADVAPLVQRRCLGCHSVSQTGSQRHGAPVGVNFDTYEDASRLATAMDDLIQSGVMPPTGALPGSEQAIFGAWVDTGRPAGVCE